MEAPCVQWDESRERLRDTLIRLERVRSICLPYALKAFNLWLFIQAELMNLDGKELSAKWIHKRPAKEPFHLFFWSLIICVYSRPPSPHHCRCWCHYPSSIVITICFIKSSSHPTSQLSHPSLYIIIQPSHSSYPLSIIQIHHLPLKPQDIFLPKTAWGWFPSLGRVLGRWEMAESACIWPSPIVHF